MSYTVLCCCENVLKMFWKWWACAGGIYVWGQTKVIDVLAIVNLILDEDYNLIADLNEDNEINVLDILLLVTIILEEF